MKKQRDKKKSDSRFPKYIDHISMKKIKTPNATSTAPEIMDRKPASTFIITLTPIFH
jgi:hypothetical protein